jgi:hypothetical protein
MAELVDALVSNTSDSNIVGVQFPLRVQIGPVPCPTDCISGQAGIPAPGTEKERECERVLRRVGTLISFSSKLKLVLTHFLKY